jgi:hypothetical protein
MVWQTTGHRRRYKCCGKTQHEQKGGKNSFAKFHFLSLRFNPEFAVAIYCGLKILAAKLVSQFYSSTDLWICLRRKIVPTAHFAKLFYASLRSLLQNLGLRFDRIGDILCLFAGKTLRVGYCHPWGLGEKHSPSGEDFTVTLWEARVQGVEAHDTRCTIHDA